ncbi:MAG: hypothetical protein K2K55_07110, partial [Duncaniella sp.]|nr:hypothetical protein [Duncaniella sp.]
HMRQGDLTELLGTFNMLFLLVAASYAASVSFRDLGRKSAATSLLMLPASDTEKFLSRWLLTIPLAFLWLMAIAYAGDYLSAFLAGIFFNTGYKGAFGWNICVTDSLDVPMAAATMLFLQSFFFLGSLLWPRFSWCKSLLALILLICLCIGIVMTVIYSLRVDSGMSMTVNILDRSDLIVTLLGLAVINFIISFFCFREAEIINRW